MLRSTTPGGPLGPPDHFWRRPLRRAVLAVLATAVLTVATSAHAALSIFELADQSDVVVIGTVKSAVPTKNGKLEVFTIEPARALKGDAGAELHLVQELLFRETKPYFAAGTRTLVFVVPLPNYTTFRDALGEGAFWRWSERLETAADIAPLSDAMLVEPLAEYLAVRHDPAATARVLGRLLASPSPKLRSDALAALEAREELMPLLDADALAPWQKFLADQRMPPAERAEPLVRLARRGAVGVVPIAAEIAASGGPLQAAAVDALVSLGKPPEESRLLTYSHSDEPALRIAAVRGLARTPTDGALARLETMITQDPSREVRVAALQALGQTQDDRAVAMLAKATGSKDKDEINAAAESLGRIASPAALKALTDILVHGGFDAQTAAAFALKRSGKWEAIEALEDQAANHPDPRVRKIADIALGHAKHEH